MKTYRSILAMFVSFLIVLSMNTAVVFAGIDVGLYVTISADEVQFTAGDNVTYKVNVFNNGSKGTYNNVTIVSGNNKWDIRQIKKGETQTFEFANVYDEPGEYTVAVEALDKKGAVISKHDTTVKVIGFNHSNTIFREHVPIRAVPLEEKANIINSRWIELYLPENAYNTDHVTNVQNYSITSLYDTSFSSPVVPMTVHHRWWSETAPYLESPIGNDYMAYQTVYRIYLQLPDGKQLKEGYPYMISVDQSVGIGGPFEAVFSLTDVNDAIHVNQESYTTNGSKVAYLSWWTGDGGSGLGEGSINFDPYEKFHLVDEKTGLSVFAGDVSFVMPGSDEKWGKSDLYALDFSDFKTEGTYHIYIPDVGISYSFKIGTQSFRDSIGYNVFRGLLMQRDGNHGLDDPSITHWTRPAAHLDDAIDQSTGLQVDLTGGHMDAGDRGKYPYNTADTSTSLLMAAIFFPDEVEALGDYVNLPESGNDIPDFLDELVYELDFLYKAVMNTNRDGALPEYLRPSSGGYEFGYDAEGASGRVFFNTNPGVIKTRTLYAAGALALAYNTPLMQQYYPEKCEQYLEAAKRAFNGFEGHYTDDSFWRADMLENGAYEGANHVWSKEMVFAAANLLEATGDQKYNNWVKAELPSRLDETIMHWGWTIDGPWPNAFASIIRCRYIDQETKDRAFNAVKYWGEKGLSGDSPYGANMPAEQAALVQIGWYFTASNVGYPLFIAYGVTGEQKYQTALEKTWNYLMGTNPTSRSMISGLGDPAKRPHFLVHEISYYQLTHGHWQEMIPGIPSADIQDFRLRSQWSGEFSSQWNRDKEALTGYPYPNDDTSSFQKYAPLWRWADAWNVQNEFIIANIARQVASVVPLLGTEPDASRSPEIALDRPGRYTFNTVAGYDTAEILSVKIMNTGFYTADNLFVTLVGSDKDKFTVTQPGTSSIEKDSYTTFTISPKTGVTEGMYTAQVIVTGNSMEPRVMDVALNVSGLSYSLDLYDGTRHLSGGTYDIPSAGLGYTVTDTLSVKVLNSGTGNLTDLSASLSGKNSDSFSIIQPDDTLPFGKSTTFNIKPNLGLDIGEYTATVTVTGSGRGTGDVTSSFEIRFNVYAANYKIDLMIGENRINDSDYKLPGVGENYKQQPTTVTVKNVGLGTITNLRVELDSDTYTVEGPVVPTLTERQKTTFSIAPVAALVPGVYTVNVTVRADNDVNQTFQLSMTVHPYKISTIGNVDEYDVMISDSGMLSTYVNSTSGQLSDQWANNKDGFLYVYKDDLIGDQTISVKIDAFSGSGMNSQTGLMFRQDTGDSAAYFRVGFRLGEMAWGGTGTQHFQTYIVQRNTNGAYTEAAVIGSTGNTPPRWLKIVKTGNTFQAFISADSTDGTDGNWMPLGNEAGYTVPISDGFCAGLMTSTTDYQGDPYWTRASFNNISIGTQSDPVAYPFSSVDINVNQSAKGATKVYPDGKISVYAETLSSTNWVQEDSLRYVYSDSLTGNQTIIAKLEAFKEASGIFYSNSKAGLMIRNSLDKSSAWVGVFMLPNGNIRAQARTAEGGNSNWFGQEINAIDPKYPRWLKLEASNSNVTAYYSDDGNKWINIGSSILPAMDNFTAGLFVVTGKDNWYQYNAEATFNNVSWPIKAETN